LHKIEIRRPRLADIEELNAFFKTVLIDTFAREGITNMDEDIKSEIETKGIYLNRDLDSNGENRYFLIALIEDKIIGSIEYGASSELIDKCTEGALKEIVELGTVFVHPNYQRQGVGNLLLNEMYKTFKEKGVKEFCLDSGYSNAQKVWKSKFGEPNYLFKDFWCKGNDHMIWKVRTSDILIRE